MGQPKVIKKSLANTLKSLYVKKDHKITMQTLLIDFDIRITHILGHELSRLLEDVFYASP